MSWYVYFKRDISFIPPHQTIGWVEARIARVNRQASAVMWVLSKCVPDCSTGLWDGCAVGSVSCALAAETPFSRFKVLVLPLRNLLRGRKATHLVVSESWRKISLPTFIAYLPSHLCAYDREDKWIQQEHAYWQQRENSPLKISDAVKAITLCEDQSVLVQAVKKWRTNHGYVLKDTGFYEVMGKK